MFVSPRSYYALEDLLEKLGEEEEEILHGWTDVTSCLRCGEEEEDLKFFSRDENTLDEIHGENIPDGTQTLVLEKIFLNLTNKHMREVSLRHGTFKFVMFGVEVEDNDKKRVHMLGQGTSNNFLDITIDTIMEGKR